MKILFLFLFLSLSLLAKDNGNFLIKINNFNGTINSLLKEKLIDSDDYSFYIYKASNGLTGNRYYKYRYKYKDISVEHRTLVITMDKLNNFISLSGSFVKPNISNITPRLKSKEVFDNFRKTILKMKFHGDIKKVILIKNSKTYLVYKALVEYFDQKGHHLGMLYLDANSSEKVDFITYTQDALYRETYDFHNRCFEDGEDYYAMPGICEANNPDNPTGTNRCSGTLIFAEGNPNNTDSDALNAYNNSGITYWFYNNMFNRDSFDNSGISLVSTVHVEFYDDGYGCHGYNASFMREPFNQMVYGDGDPNNPNDNYSRALDVVAHELTHAVTNNESVLIYQDESGAINEALSDIFGASTEAWSNSGGTSNGNPNVFTTNANTWKIGEDLGEPIRYMNNPTLDNRSYDYYPTRYIGDYDNGGVHLNSGIMNLAFYLLVSGGAHPTQNHEIIVNGIGIEKAIRIYYEAATNLFVENTTFEMARSYLAQAAETLYGNCSNEYEQVHLSFDSVGVLGVRDGHCLNSYNDECTTDNQCNSGYCFNNLEGNGYCSKTCNNDSDCALDNENTVCVHYDNNDSYCVKVSDTCTDLDRDNQAYESCNSDCSNADCQEDLLCINEVCTPSCSGYDDESCLDGYSCYNWNTIDNPMFKCLATRDYCEDESECGDNSCYYLYTTKINNQNALQAVCKAPLGERRDGEPCVKDSNNPSESCRTGFCFGQNNDFKCSEICNSSTDCNGDSRLCLAFTWYNDYDGKLPVCVVDDLIWDNIRFEGMCSQENGCPQDSICLFNQIRTVVDSSDDLEYICYSGINSGNGSYGESCNSWEDCEGRACNNGKCTSYCDTNQNCLASNSHCDSAVNYYAGREDVKLKICVDGAPYDCSDDPNSKVNETNDGCICKTDYILEDICINHKNVSCLDVTPAVATSNIVNVEINYTSADGWSTPANCDWSCKTNSTLINGICSCDENFVLINNSCVNLCENNSCNTWESCNLMDGSCNLLENRCNSNSDCEENYVCNSEHNCVDLCVDNSCNTWESCNLTDGSCNLLENRCNNSTDCDEGYICNNEHNCIDLCENNNCTDWESCNSTDGSCNLLENRCNNSTDCEDNYNCNSEHTCVNLCENNNCNSWESCNSTDGSCNLLENRCNNSTDCEDNYNCNSEHTCIKDKEAYKGSSLFGCNYGNTQNNYIFLFLFFLVFIRLLIKAKETK